MESQTRRTLLATVLCIVVLIGWMRLSEWLYPPPPPTTSTAPTSAMAERPEPGEPATRPSSGPAASSGPSISAAPTGASPGVERRGLTAVSLMSGEPIALGDDRQNNPRAGFSNPWEFRVVVEPRGAAIESIRLSRHRNHVAKDKKNPDHDPYNLITPLMDPRTGTRTYAFASGKVKVDNEEVDLSSCVWSAEKSVDGSSQAVTLSTVVKDAASDVGVLRLVKKYRITQGSPHLDIELSVENLSSAPRKVVFNEGGPMGLPHDDPRTEYRRIVAGLYDEDGRIILGEHPLRDEVAKQADRTLPLRPGEDRFILWTALVNKYFAVILTPLPSDPAARVAQYITRVTARAPLGHDLKPPPNDLSFDFAIQPAGDTIAPGKTETFRLQAYCGSKAKSTLTEIPEGAQRDYYLVTSADRTGCNIEAISTVMLWLLTGLHALVRNYGIAIIMLVIIVKVLLHPISRRGQMNMMRMQKNMATLRPKQEALQRQYKNDKQKYHEELMKLYREEGVNPAANMLGCLPMFLQMPIWVALWTTLNTNVDMRHQPFFWWIRDLSSPDALIPFSSDFTIPIVSWITGPIGAFNLLPVIMAITMYAQQKLSQKMAKPATPPPQQFDDQGRPIPDTMAQQQKMMNFMTIFFGLMFYNFPSGLSLYILSNNLLGMVEQYIIRREIKAREARGEFAPGKPGGTGRPSRFQKFLENIQKRAEEARMQKARGDDRFTKRKPKKS